MTYLLDSNIISEVTKAKPDPAVVAWLDAHELDCAVSTITLAELRYGIERLPDGKRRQQLERDFAFFRQDLGNRVLAFDEAEATEWGGTRPAWSGNWVVMRRGWLGSRTRRSLQPRWPIA